MRHLIASLLSTRDDFTIVLKPIIVADDSGDKIRMEIIEFTLKLMAYFSNAPARPKKSCQHESLHFLIFNKIILLN